MLIELTNNSVIENLNSIMKETNQIEKEEEAFQTIDTFTNIID